MQNAWKQVKRNKGATGSNFYNYLPKREAVTITP
jgi:hypothetical protein